MILGPREYVGRLPWWLRRIAHDELVIAPAPAARSIQPIDVRDVADFALLCAEERLSSALNLAAPIGRETFGDLIAACIRATGSEPQVFWADELRP